MLCGMGWKMGMGLNSLALLLIALGIGAIVKFKAIKATECRNTGKAVGYFIMIVAALGIVFKGMCMYKCIAGCAKDKPGCHDCADKNADRDDDKKDD